MVLLYVERYGGRFLRLVTEDGRLGEPIVCKLKPTREQPGNFWHSGIIYSVQREGMPNWVDVNSTDRRVSGRERYFTSDPAYVVPQAILLKNAPYDIEIMQALREVTPQDEWNVGEEVVGSLQDIRSNYTPRTLV